MDNGSDHDTFYDDDGDSFLSDEGAFGAPYAPVGSVDEMGDSFVDNGGITGAAVPLLGHTANEVHIQHLVQQGKLPHALLLVGPRGVGKRLFAMKLARGLLALGDNSVDNPVDSGPSLFGDPTPAAPTAPGLNLDLPVDHPVARLISARAHPDFLMLGNQMDEASGDGPAAPMDAPIPVEAVREINKFLHLTAGTVGGWRVVIVDNADTMNRNAQNALLKILEEPPARTVLILIAHQMGSLLPTIRSRTQVLTFSALDPPDFDRAVQNMGVRVPESHMKWVRALSNGCPGQAIAWADPAGWALAQEFWALWHNFPAYDDLVWATFVDKFGDKKQAESRGYDTVLSLWEWMIRAALRAKVDVAARARTAGLVGHPFFAAMVDQISLAAWVEMAEDLPAHFSKIRTAALEKRQGLWSARYMMEAAARGTSSGSNSGSGGRAVAA